MQEFVIFTWFLKVTEKGINTEKDYQPITGLNVKD